MIPGLTDVADAGGRRFDSSVRGRPFDVIANRALLFLGLTGVGVLAYALAVGVLGPKVPAHGANAILVGAALAATLLVLRDWVQRAVDWLLYGDRNDPQRALLRVGDRVAAVPDPAALVPALLEAVASSLRLSFVAAHLDDPRWDVAIGTAPSRVSALPLTYHGDEVGHLIAGRRGESVTGKDLRVLSGVAPQLAAAAQLLRLNANLAAARERLVRAREEERRRLHRDMHDVLGPALAGVGLGLDAARLRALRDPAGADELLGQVQMEVRACVGDLRQIIDGLRPPTLDERGLLGALQHHARVIAERHADLRIAADGRGLPALPAAVEVVAYLIAQEAVNNAVRHAAAHNIRVDLQAVDDELVLEVADDGIGLPDNPVHGLGIDSMTARAEELNGVVTMTRGASVGTCVRARLPLRTGTR